MERILPLSGMFAILGLAMMAMHALYGKPWSERTFKIGSIITIVSIVVMFLTLFAAILFL